MSCQAQRVETLQQENQPEIIKVTGTDKVISLVIYLLKLVALFA